MLQLADALCQDASFQSPWCTEEGQKMLLYIRESQNLDDDKQGARVRGSHT